MRDLTKTDKNVLKITDSISASEIELYYRNPATTEIVAYQNRMYRREGNKVKIDAANTRIDFGLKVLTGFRDGDFGIDGKPISADPASPGYCKDWKTHLKENAGDIIMTLAMHVFEGIRTGSQEKIEIEMEDVGEDTLPLAKS